MCSASRLGQKIAKTDTLVAVTFPNEAPINFRSVWGVYIPKCHGKNGENFNSLKLEKKSCPSLGFMILFDFKKP